MRDDAIYSLLNKGLSCDVTPRTTPIEDILAGDEKAAQSLPVKMEEEARQETVRFIKRSSRPETTKAEKEALRTLKNNIHLAIVPADKGNATVILITVDYKQKIIALLEDPSYKRMARDPTESTERKTTLLLIKSTHRRYLRTTVSGRLQIPETIWTSQGTQRGGAL